MGFLAHIFPPTSCAGDNTAILGNVGHSRYFAPYYSWAQRKSSFREGYQFELLLHFLGKLQYVQTDKTWFRHTINTTWHSWITDMSIKPFRNQLRR